MTPDQPPQSNINMSALVGDALAPHGSVESGLPSVGDSAAAIGAAVRHALRDHGLSLFLLHEMSGIPLDVVADAAGGVYDMTDSAPISAIERALKIPLQHL